MKFLANANALFIGLRETKSYHEALQVGPARRDKLLEARALIRERIREEAKRIRSEDQFWDSNFAARARRTRPEVSPKFFTQGSVAYNLLVDPVLRIVQQLDLDDGMYVGVEYLQNGKPALVAQALFNLVEEALAPLCKERDWKLDKSKETCVRVVLDTESHIDIPIYSAPADRMIAMDAVVLNARADSVILKRAGHEYAKLPADKIMLAHRFGGWDQSDPLALHEWVDHCAERYGELFRRACRYFKGWRDFRWSSGHLTSITIMAATAEALEDMNGAHRSLSDDQVVYEISQRLPEILERDILNPAFPGHKKILNDWPVDDRREIVRAAHTLAEQMTDALVNTGVAELVIEALRKAFGDRIPNRPDVIKIAPPVAVAVLRQAAATTPIPKVTSSTSG